MWVWVGGFAFPNDVETGRVRRVRRAEKKRKQQRTPPRTNERQRRARERCEAKEGEGAGAYTRTSVDPPSSLLPLPSCILSGHKRQRRAQRRARVRACVWACAGSPSPSWRRTWAHHVLSALDREEQRKVDESRRSTNKKETSIRRGRCERRGTCPPALRQTRGGRDRYIDIHVCVCTGKTEGHRARRFECKKAVAGREQQKHAYMPACVRVWGEGEEKEGGRRDTIPGKRSHDDLTHEHVHRPTSQTHTRTRKHGRRKATLRVRATVVKEGGGVIWERGRACG